MDKQQAQGIIRETFENAFDEETFTDFIKNLLNKIDEDLFIYQGQYIPDSYKPFISKYLRLGKFNDGKNRVDILIVYLTKETSIERARSRQRNFIAGYLQGKYGSTNEKNAALVAFVSPDKADWRFSLVKLDYLFKTRKDGIPKAIEEFTPARRWSFLMGANEKSHTAQSRLVGILANDEQAPTLEEIEKAFDIETVTKEFFLRYRELFLRTKEELDRVIKNDPKIKADFDDKGVDTVNFSKKLLGQIVFLYFLQKKGWFGVGRDDDWDTGSKHFLRELFDKKHSDYNNFYNDILEPLFYEALRIDRSHDDGYFSRFDCKIPFLDGGLFDPIGNYDWVHTDIIIPDKLFSNTKKTKEGDIGDGILDIFDRYNFTVKEDEPLEKEVAIDPELLGKAYEKFNAIRPDNYVEFRKALKSGKTGEENKFNKKFGVYYTPREIVHYMCQQSLINYLATELENKVKKEAIEFLILEGEIFIEYLKTAKDKKEANENYKGNYKENEHFLLLKKHANEIDNSLSKIKVCDPSVGSGAFPVGMMTEITKSRMFFVETNCLDNIYINSHQEKVKRNTYNYKRDCIEQSLYGVDIDPGAVEIAKLRLWLSLVVDEEDIKNIKPLPNLDYRIMQGNSLISEFMGINFDTEKEINTENLLPKDETNDLIEHFQQKKDDFLNESNVTRKSKLKEEIDVLMICIFETKLKVQRSDYFKRLEDIENKYSALPNEKQRNELIEQNKEKLYKESGFDIESAEKQLKEFTSGRQIKPFFLWNLYFSEVFHNNGGFDVVVANPPYVRVDEIPIQQKLQFKKLFKSSVGKYDIYYLFIEKAVNLTKKNGNVVFITPNKYCAASSGKILRKIILNTMGFCEIVSTSKLGVFEQASNYPVISILKKSQPTTQFTVREALDISNLRDSTNNIYNLEHAKFNQLPEVIIPINVSQEKVNVLIRLLEKYPRLRNYLSISEGLRIPEKYEQEDVSDFGIVKQYQFSRWTSIKEGTYISRKKLNKVISQTSTRFKKIINNKILIAEDALQITATIDVNKNVPQGGVYFGTVVNDNINLKVILALMNSKLLSSIYEYLFSGMHMGGGYLRYRTKFLEELPIAVESKDTISKMIAIINRILSITKDNNYQKKQSKVKTLEQEIDQLVYKLYNLTPKEIKIVEGKNAI